MNSGQNICRPRVYRCNGSKFDWPMKDMSINPKKVGGRNLEEDFGQALFFVSPTPHYVPREPDRRLVRIKKPGAPLLGLAKSIYYFFYFGSFFLVSFMFQLISAVLSSFTNF